MSANDVAQELEARIREAIERMVADIRSSIDDVREVVDQQLKAALQSVQADANTTSFRELIEGALEGMAHPGEAAAAPEPKESARRVKGAVQAIERGQSQVEVLNGLLDQSLRFGSRASLLILKGETLAGWKGVGYARFGGDDEAIRRFAAAPGDVPELDRLLRDERPVEWSDDSFSSRLGVPPPVRSIAIPMVIKDKIAAAVLLELAPGEEESFDQDAIELLVFTTGLLIDTLAIRKRIPSPAFSAGTEGEQSAPEAAQPRAAAAPPPRSAEPQSPPQAAPPPPTAPSERPEATEGDAAAEASAAPPAEAEAPREVARGESGATTGTISPGRGAGELADRSTTQYIPPAGIQRRFQRSTAQEGEDARRHDEARRFARLLVSEIKLYNESKVDQGRRNRDLYDRMKEDIDRSRQMYEDRIAEDVRKSSNYFFDELVRILADGDADALGM